MEPTLAGETTERPLWMRCLVGLIAVLIAAAVRWLLDPWLGDRLPFLTIFGGVAFAVWYGGTLPGILSMLAGLLLGNYFFLQPRGSIILSGAQLAMAIGYTLSCGFIIVMGESMRRAQRRAEREARERRLAEEVLRAHDSELQQVINGTPFMLTRCSRDLRYLFVSRAYAEMIGRQPEEVAGRPIREIMGETGFASIEPFIQRVLKGERVEYEEAVNFAGIGKRQLHVVYTPDIEADEVVGWFASIVDFTERENARATLRRTERQHEALYRLASHLQRTKTSEQVYNAALDAIIDGLGCNRASILLFDDKRVMRFVASRGLSEQYRAAVEGHSPWTPDTTDAEPIALNNVAEADLEESLKATVRKEGIAACAFIPLASSGRLIGKFMAYCNEPYCFSATDLETGLTIGRQLASAIERQHAEENLRESEERLRIATSTGKVGAWEWDIATNKISWSDSLYAIHGLTKESFGGTIDDFAKLVHPDDSARVAAAIRQSVEDGTPYEATFRVVKPSGETVWLFTNAVVMRAGDKAVRMIGATTDITELKQAEEELQRAKATADEANKAKDQFLAMLSHELRTPLTPVLMAAGLLEHDHSLPAPVLEQLAMIRRNAELEARLIDDLLDVTRITHGKFELHEEMVDVHTLIEHALRISSADLLGKQLQVTKYLQAGMHRCHADAARLQEVFWNIIRNAVKFTPDHGQIVISTRNDDRQQIVIEFTDNGIGIEPALQPRIFDAFAQGDRAMSAQFGGLGLGLAISKRIVDLHGGTIEARSAGRGKGSTFIITLSAVADLSARPAMPDVEAPTVATSTCEILIVEDHEDTARVLSRILETSGYQVALARSLLEARTLAASQRFDIVISDLGLPDGSGLDLMRELRAQQDVIGIAVSGYGTIEDVRASEEAGFAVHLTKPVDIERLQTAIRNSLGGTRAIRSTASERSPVPF